MYLRRRIIPDLKELEEKGFRCGTGKMKKLLVVLSRSQRNDPFISAVTRPVLDSNNIFFVSYEFDDIMFGLNHMLLFKEVFALGG